MWGWFFLFPPPSIFSVDMLAKDGFKEECDAAELAAVCRDAPRWGGWAEGGTWGAVEMSRRRGLLRHAGESPAEFNVCFTRPETGFPTDKPADETWSWLWGEDEERGKIRRFCSSDGILYGIG